MSLPQTDPGLTHTIDKEGETAEVPQIKNFPTTEELGVLSPMERVAFRFTHRMNQGRIKKFWTFCQRTLGAGWIHISTYNIMRVYGLEHVQALAHDRPLLLVSNHRSFFDMYVVSAMLFRLTRWEKRLFFPVRGRFFYESPLGMFVNFIMGWWSMYPPVFLSQEKRLFDRYSLRVLTELCHEGPGHIIGFHPEGTRNKGDDPYSFLRPKPGVGKLIKEAQPDVIPVFVAGLSNDLPRQVLGNWRGGEKIRVHFGPRLDYSRFLSKRDHVSTHLEIAEFVMEKIGELARRDREMKEVGDFPKLH